MGEGNVTGIILAGGQSSRMGRDKAELPWGDSTLLAAMVDKLSTVCRPIVVVGPKRALDRDVLWTEDRYAAKGPLAGLHAGLTAINGEGALVIACDMPAVPIRIFEELLHRKEDADIVIPVHAGGYEPLCAWYSKGCLPVVERLLDGGYTRLLDILPLVQTKKLAVEEVLKEAAPQRFFLNLNYPSDYQDLKKCNQRNK